MNPKLASKSSLLNDFTCHLEICDYCQQEVMKNPCEVQVGGYQ